MRLVDIYRLAVKKGIGKDPRGVSGIREELRSAKKEYNKAKGPDKKAFDKESFTNPYADTRILYGDPDRDIGTMMVGIDMEAPEIIAADRLIERGVQVDLVMAHHPEGAAWAKFHDVMKLQVAMLARCGVPKDVGAALQGAIPTGDGDAAELFRFLPQD